MHNGSNSRHFRWKREPRHSYDVVKMSVNSASTIFGLVSQVIKKWLGQCHTYSKYWPPLWAEETVTHSLPHLENKCQRSVNNCWSGMSVKYRVIWSLLDILKVLAIILGNRDIGTLPARSWKWASIDSQQVGALHRGWSKRNVAVIDYIQSFDWFYRLKRSCTLSCSIEYGLSCYCPGSSRGNISCSSASEGYQLLVYRCLRSSATYITHQESLMLHWGSLWRWGREHFAYSCAYRGYQNMDYI